MKRVVILLALIVTMLAFGSVFAEEGVSPTSKEVETALKGVNTQLDGIAVMLENEMGYVALGELKKVEKKLEEVGVEVINSPVPALRALAHKTARIEDLIELEALREEGEALLRSADRHIAERETIDALWRQGATVSPDDEIRAQKHKEAAEEDLRQLEALIERTKKLRQSAEVHLLEWETHRDVSKKK